MIEKKKMLLRDAQWFFGEKPGEILTWALEEASSLVEKLTGKHAGSTPSAGQKLTIAVGSPESNSLVRDSGMAEMGKDFCLGPDDYIIRSSSLKGKPVLYIAGKNERAAMYGLFAFLEALGCRFLVSRDVVPEPDPGIEVPLLNITGKTLNPWRAVWLQFCFVGNSIMSVSDYERLFNQMAKMRMNRVIYYLFENEPFMDYSYAGERKLVGDATPIDSACMSLGRQDTGTYRVSDMIAGRGKFDREFVSPREFQDARTSQEMLDTGRAFMQKLIGLAASRGIGTWISFDSAFVSLNMAKYTRRMARPHEVYCALTSFTDPVVDEINRNRIENIVKNYRDIEGIFFQITEGAYEDPYPESQETINRLWLEYRESYELLKKHWGKWWQGEEKQRTYMRADIGFVERMKKSIAAAREIKPSLRLGVLTVCKAYLLTYLDRILPKEMPFVDIESQSLWTVDGAPLYLFRRMEGRECVPVPRAYDDGSLAGLQFNLNLYQRDGFVQSRRENGTGGLCIQLTHVAGNDHNVRFLADGMWNEELTPDGFYRDYAETVFGDRAAEHVIRAFSILEKNEAFLGGRGLKNMPYSLNPPEIYMLRAARSHATPFFSAPWDDGAIKMLTAREEKFREAIAMLRESLEYLDSAGSHCKASGITELEYLKGKTKAYILHLETLCMFKDAYALYVKAFAGLETGRPASCREGLRRALLQAGRAEENAVKSAEEFARVVAHPTDLAAVWMMNHVIIACRVLRQFTHNVLCCFDGKEYWNKVDWDLLYDTSPFPTYQVEGRETLIFG